MSNQREPTEFYDPKTIDITDRTDLADDEFYVEKVIRKRIGQNYQTEYQIKWVDYPSSANTWESIENVDKSAELIKEFEEERLQNARTKRAKRLQVAENLTRSLIDNQIKAFIESPEDIQEVIGFIPSAKRFIIMWKGGYILEMPSTYLNRLMPDKRKLFMDCLGNLQEEYVEYTKLKANPLLMASQLKKIQAQNADKEKKKAKAQGVIKKRLATIKKWLQEETDDEEMSDEEISDEETEEEEKNKEDEETKRKMKLARERCLQIYLKNVSLKQQNACKAYLAKHYNDNSSDSGRSDEESDNENLKDFENDDEDEENKYIIKIEEIDPKNIPKKFETMEEENEEEADKEEEDEVERNLKREKEREKEEYAGFVAAATAAAEAIDADTDSSDDIIYPQEALFPVVCQPKATSDELFPKPKSESTIVPMEIDESSKRKRSPSPDYPPFDMGPSTSTGSKGIGLPSYIDIKRLTTFSDSDSD